jgi:hypothetical protein
LWYIALFWGYYPKVYVLLDERRLWLGLQHILWQWGYNCVHLSFLALKFLIYFEPNVQIFETYRSYEWEKMKSCLRLLVCNDIFHLAVTGWTSKMVMKITNRSSTHRFKICVDFFFLVQYSDASFGDTYFVVLIWHFGGIIFFGRFPLWVE